MKYRIIWLKDPSAKNGETKTNKSIKKELDRLS